MLTQTWYQVILSKYKNCFTDKGTQMTARCGQLEIKSWKRKGLEKYGYDQSEKKCITESRTSNYH